MTRIGLRHLPQPPEPETVAPCPEVDLDLLKWLEATYPPRCYEGEPGQSIEQHLKYAGAVGLISLLRNTRDQQVQDLMENALAANLTRSNL